MKRITALLLALLLVMTMAACGGQKETSIPIYTTPTPTNPSGTDATNPNGTEPSTSPTEPSTSPTGPSHSEHIHKYTSEVIKEPTCVEPGKIALSCECGETDTVEVKPTGHDYQTEVTKDATCVEVGEIIYTCHCGDMYTEEIALVDHQWSKWEETKRPTMYEPGEAQRICAVCGNSETKELAVYTAEEALATYVDLIIDLPTFTSADELYGGALFSWLSKRVPTVRDDWDEETCQITRVYSLDDFDMYTTYYLGQTYDFIYLTEYNDDLTYDEANNQLIWVTYGAGGGLYADMDSYEKIDDTHYVLHYSTYYYEDDSLGYQGTLNLVFMNGRFVIESHTNNR